MLQDATAEKLEGPDWAKSLAICDLVNAQKASGQEVTLAVKKRLAARDYRAQVSSQEAERDGRPSHW